MNRILQGKGAGLRSTGLAGCAVAALFAVSGAANAATVSYFLDQSNRLDDGTNYLQVTIADGLDGAIDFTVTPLEPLTGAAKSGFGIREFSFNVLDEMDGGTIVGLPSGWRIREDKRQDGFGFFDVELRGRPRTEVEELKFSIVDVDGDTPEDYVDWSTGFAKEGNTFFAARVTGFHIFQPRPCRGSQSWSCEYDPADDLEGYFQGPGRIVKGADFGGSLAVPLPAVAWLFFSGLVPFFVKLRRRAATPA